MAGASPDDGARLAARILDKLAEAELALMQIIVNALRTGIEGPRWELSKLAQVQLLRQQLTAGARKADQALAAEVHEIVWDAYNTGQALAVTDLQAAGRAVTLAPDPLATADGFAQAAVDNLATALHHTPKILTDVYLDAVHAGAAEVPGITRVQASQHVLNDLASRGVTGFTDKAGRNWDLSSYAEMAVRTSAGAAAIQGHVDSLAASGMDLVIVSDAPRECPLCRKYERQVLSLSGVVGAVIEPSVLTGNPITVRVMATLEEARANGLFHCNCRHSVSLYQPGVTKHGNARTDPDGYEAGQRQRTIERHIRAWKRREQVALSPGAAAQARVKIREWQAAAKANADANDFARLTRREQIGQAR